MKKLTPLAPESTNKDLEITFQENNPSTALPRVTAQPPRVKSTSLHDPEIMLNKSYYKTISPKILHDDATKHSAEAYHQGTFQKEPPVHRYPTRTKVARAAATVQQLEASQIKNPSSPTFDFNNFTIENPPNKLKYKDLIKLNDKYLWAKGMSNKLGCLSQGFGNVKSNNTLYFITKSQVPHNKRVTYARIVCSIRP